MSVKSKVNNIFKVLKEKNPNPKTELEYSSVFTLLVAVVLSAQSTDKGVNAVTRKLFKEANTPQKMVELGEKKIKKLISNNIDNFILDINYSYNLLSCYFIFNLFDHIYFF